MLARPAPRAGAFQRACPCGANSCPPCSWHGAHASAAVVWKAPSRGSAVGGARLQLAFGSGLAQSVKRPALAQARLKSGSHEEQRYWAASCTVMINRRTGDVESPWSPSQTACLEVSGCVYKAYICTEAAVLGCIQGHFFWITWNGCCGSRLALSPCVHKCAVSYVP